MNRNRKPRHPGALIKRQYLEPLNMEISELASHLNVPENQLSEIVNEKASITPEMAMVLSIVFQTTPALWLNLQRNYDLWVAVNESQNCQSIKPISFENYSEFQISNT